MQQFNINTLVRVKSNSDATLINSGRAVEFTGKVVGLHPRNGICVHPFDGNPIEGDWYLPEELTLWQPQKGEWCWFYDKTSSAVPILAQFDYMSEHIYVTTEIEIPLSEEERSAYGFNSCIPFIGQLPEIPKDRV